MKKGIILSASTGAGHNKAAKAIKDALAERSIDAQIVDSLRFTNKAIDLIISRGYEKSALYTPNAYGKVYRIYDDFKIMTSAEKKVNIFFAYMVKRLKKLIDDKKPSFIVGTHPFPLMAVSKLKEKGEIDIPIISVLTDYTTHSTWIQSHVDKYIVGDEFVKCIMTEEGVASEKIFPYGIPIEKAFMRNNSTDIRTSLNLNDKFTILMMGGSFGAGNVKKALKELLQSDSDFQIVVVAGKNLALKDKLEKITAASEKRKDIRILGFTDKVSELMSCSDVLITKPGGLTTTEALAAGIPLVIPYYIPGQEEENLTFLLNNGLCVRTSEKCSLKMIVDFLIQNPERLQRIRENIKLVHKSDSAKNIAKLIENSL
ncbi:MAG: glycosyltransferase [Peptoclostridium sp.]|uniref:MGDG synthase family glycosyltransferase n=1 Tax=Peptoclostridium sp. TaxID=1904860 RepID=UPI00139CAA4D|nr:glycosyltransferase [Peptoclostridium sp.]MZQ74816.1 glycosyltransferase [Peptoclostridium sp.]